ncbi:MAG: hypothetical protein FJ387_12875 [Verrucomicrobia bacterium]|nr:hypothetical protein [Verrucomicrobiota bacterium]
MKPPLQRPEPDWDDELHRRLKELPDRPAPATLLPRVLAALEARARVPWYRRTWWHWPPAAQGLALLLASGLLGGLLWLALHAGELNLASAAGQRIGGWLAPLSPLVSLGEALGRVVGSLTRQLNGWVVGAAALLGSLVYVSGIGVGTACYRLARYRRKL